MAFTTSAVLFALQMFKLVVLAVICVLALAQQCPPNEEFRECGTACEPKCNVPESPICTMQCIVNVCQCKPGFKRGPNGCVSPGPGCE
ncbi:trypsin Inhibitor like cysteine rich domain protein [Oesophagostomum dentatum]|uniref:Trypsin Inhibitor like cysteine rich domain protein n=1 Tax=Oesophagostomum dentatum TaxID=61180 RepID=A0A0B1TPD4_OESDE|nr:trypsin Inhibitor like cysteine rich domain protein [Oesophagostomum dentatum]